MTGRSTQGTHYDAGNGLKAFTRAPAPDSNPLQDTNHQLKELTHDTSNGL